jgi:hypothetical protein
MSYPFSPFIESRQAHFCKITGAHFGEVDAHCRGILNKLKLIYEDAALEQLEGEMWMMFLEQHMADPGRFQSRTRDIPDAPDLHR